MAINKVFLFVPNLIGYARMALYLASFLLHSLGHWQWCAVLYFLGFFGDNWDGYAARKLDQHTKFGAALDMVEDRIATTGLCLILAQLYPELTFVLILLITLDIGSHYYLVYLTAAQGEKSHKEQATASEYRLLKLYYGNAHVMRFLVIGNEVVYFCLYILYYTADFRHSWSTWDSGFWQIFLVIHIPMWLLKQFINILQLKSSTTQIASIDAKEHAQ